MRNRVLLAVDLAFVSLAAYGSFALRFDWFTPFTGLDFVLFLLAAILVKPVTFYCVGVYREFWPLASVRELVLIVVAISMASVMVTVVVIAELMTGAISGFPRSVLFLDYILTLLLVGGARLTVRVVADRSLTRPGSAANRTSRRVLVLGAGRAGLIVVRDMQRNPQVGMEPIAFLDDDPAKQHKKVTGIPVIGMLDQLSAVLVRLSVADVVMAMPTAPGALVLKVAESCRAAGVRFRTIPGVFELLDGQFTVKRLREVDITDLLRRAPVGMRQEPPAYLARQTVLITGAGGSIGAELCRQVASGRPAHLVLLGHGENSIFEIESDLAAAHPELTLSSVIVDVRNAGRLSAVFERIQPDIVFHAAAHKHVPLMELNPEEAISNNVFGTQNVVRASMRAGVKRFVLVSTDKAVAPISLMGASKRLAEAIVRAAASESDAIYTVVRFGNVLGSRGSVVPLFKKQIERGGPITITDPEMRRYLMTIPEAVHLVLEAGGLNRGSGLYVLNMGEPVLIVQLARDMIRLSAPRSDTIPIVFTGLRPGERLLEYLWEPDAVVTPTENPDVMAIAEPGLNGAQVSHVLDLLRVAVDEGDTERIRSLVMSVVPPPGV